MEIKENIVDCGDQRIQQMNIHRNSCSVYRHFTNFRSEKEREWWWCDDDDDDGGGYDDDDDNEGGGDDDGDGDDNNKIIIINDDDDDVMMKVVVMMIVMRCCGVSVRTDASFCSATREGCAREVRSITLLCERMRDRVGMWERATERQS